MTSLYLFVLWIPSIRNDTSSRNPIDASALDSLEDLVENGEVTVEQIWAALTEWGIAKNRARMGTVHFSSSMPSNYCKQTISFFVSSLLFLVIPCSLLLCVWIKRVFWPSPKQRRRRQLQRDLRFCRKTLREDDRIFSDCSIDNNATRRISTWKMPVAGSNLRQKEPIIIRAAQGDCVICLGPFACGDCVAWSSNSSCSHCFHYKCIMSWLSRKTTSRMKMCPCCRASFVVSCA
jgi:hypothetical protein